MGNRNTQAEPLVRQYDRLSLMFQLNFFMRLELHGRVTQFASQDPHVSRGVNC